MEKFWTKWNNNGLLDQLEQMKTIVTIIERNFSDLNRMKQEHKNLNVEELKAQFLNTYFTDMVEAIIMEDYQDERKKTKPKTNNK